LSQIIGARTDILRNWSLSQVPVKIEVAAIPIGICLCVAKPFVPNLSKQPTGALLGLTRIKIVLLLGVFSEGECMQVQTLCTNLLQTLRSDDAK
jgi:hypothetical protein